MKLQLLTDDFSVCRLSRLPHDILNRSFCFAAVTDEEISLVCPSASVPSEVEREESGWRAFRICGTLDFSLTGILTGISGVLSDNKIGIFAVSTFNTDYIFVKAENAERAAAALTEAGYIISD